MLPQIDFHGLNPFCYSTAGEGGCSLKQQSGQRLQKPLVLLQVFPFRVVEGLQLILFAKFWKYSPLFSVNTHLHSTENKLLLCSVPALHLVKRPFEWIGLPWLLTLILMNCCSVGQSHVYNLHNSIRTSDIFKPKIIRGCLFGNFGVLCMCRMSQILFIF